MLAVRFLFRSTEWCKCTIDFTGHVLHARTDRDVYVSDPWHTASDVTLSGTSDQTEFVYSPVDSSMVSVLTFFRIVEIL